MRNAHAVVSNAVEVDQVFRHQGGNTVGQQTVEKLQMMDAEVGQGVIVDRDTATEPAKGVVMAAQIVQSPGTADSLNGGQQPQGDWNLRIDGRRPRSTFHGTNGVQEGSQVKALHKLPNRAGMVFGSQQVLQTHGRDQSFPISAAQARFGLFGSVHWLATLRRDLDSRLGVGGGHLRFR